MCRVGVVYVSMWGVGGTKTERRRVAIYYYCPHTALIIPAKKVYELRNNSQLPAVEMIFWPRPELVPCILILVLPTSGVNENLETDNQCWNVFFCGQCEKILIPSHNCCCVVRKKLAWLKVARPGTREETGLCCLAWPCSKNDTNLNTDPFYFSFYLLFDLWTAKNWKFYPSNICCSNLVIIVKLCTCHASLMPLFW